MFTSPHAPLMWAYRAATKPDEPIINGPLLPITRNIKGITAYFGVGPPGGINIEGGIRKALGLPEFDEWDDYRTDRMLSNMAASNEITAADAIRAMIDRTGPIYEEAKRRAGKESGVRQGFGLVGIPTSIYPPGEEKARELYNAFGQAIEAYKDGDIEAYANFFDKYPEARARLALFDSPEERTRQFLKDEIWNRYNEMGSVNRKIVREALGQDFETFLGSSSYDSFDPQMLGAWLRMMGGDPPGTLSGNAIPIELAPPADAQAVQVFYDTRNRIFGEGIWDIQSRYFDMQEGAARKQYLADHPELKAYWDYRRDFMYRRPDLAPYIEEDPNKQPKYPSERALLSAQGQVSDAELYTILGPELYRLYLDEEPLPAAAREAIEALGFKIEE